VHSSQFQKPPPHVHDALRRTQPPGQASQVTALEQIMFPIEHGIPGCRAFEQPGASKAKGFESGICLASATVASTAASLAGAGIALPLEHATRTAPHRAG
jgi:hypothetical protein